LDPLVLSPRDAKHLLASSDVQYPKSTDEIVEESRRCQEGGGKKHPYSCRGTHRWTEVIARLRSGTDLIVQCGMSNFTIPKRMEVFEQGGHDLDHPQPS